MERQERKERLEKKLKRSSNSSMRKIRTSESSFRMKSLPRLTSHCNFNKSTLNRKSESGRREVLREDKFRLNHSQLKWSGNLDEDMKRLNSLAIRSQDKHKDWLKLHSKIIEITENMSFKENIYRPLNIDKIIGRLIDRNSILQKKSDVSVNNKHVL
jgi:hypothetical protein